MSEYTFIFEDFKNGEYIYFDDDGDLICESWTSGESGTSCNVLDLAQQKKLYEELKKKFDK